MKRRIRDFGVKNWEFREGREIIGRNGIQYIFKV